MIPIELLIVLGLVFLYFRFAYHSNQSEDIMRTCRHVVNGIKGRYNYHRLYTVEPRIVRYERVVTHVLDSSDLFPSSSWLTPKILSAARNENNSLDLRTVTFTLVCELAYPTPKRRKDLDAIRNYILVNLPEEFYP